MYKEFGDAGKGLSSYLVESGPIVKLVFRIAGYI